MHPDAIIDPLLTKRLMKYLRSKTREPEDVCQDVLLRLYRADLSHVESFNAYAVHSAKTMLADHARKARARHESQHCELPRWLPASEPPFDRHIEQIDQIQRAMIRLTSDERNVISLYFLDGFTQAEVSIATGFRIGKIKTNTFRAIRKMRKTLRKSSTTEPPRRPRAPLAAAPSYS